ncbi:MAG: LptF/LptG family permease [Verrucomicrobiota bacterium]|nr:LptF/LptG family permease [Verrucomicrobiota bacterium]
MLLFRYIFSRWILFFCLFLALFALLLLLSRFQEIARFIALSDTSSAIALFAFYHIPFFLPLAFPIAACIASFLLFQRLAKNSEFLAMRTSGLSLKKILSPLFYISLLLTLLHFFLSAEIAPRCGKKTKELLYSATSTNPLVLLQRQDLIKLKETYLTLSVQGEKAQDFFFVTKSPTTHRLNLLHIPTLELLDDELVASNATLISHLPEGKEFLETHKRISLSAPLLSLALKKHRPRLELPLLNFKMLLLRSQENGKEHLSARLEILRRIALSLAIFPFTLLGALLGAEHRASSSRKNLWIALATLLFFLFSYLGVRELKGNFACAIALALSPHLLMLYLSTKRSLFLSRGQEPIPVMSLCRFSRWSQR